MTESNIKPEDIKAINKFNAWLKKEIINKNIFSCSHQVDHKTNTILIDKGKMTLKFNKQWIYLSTFTQSDPIAARTNLNQILMDGLQWAIKEHFLKTYEA
jgi:hypothetical protein